MSLERVHHMVRSAITRGKIVACALAGRSLAQVTGLAGETKQSVEVLHPYGWFANLPAGADVVLLQVMGSRDHVVALGGDAMGQNVASAAGEFGAKHASGTFFHFTADGRLTMQDASGAKVVMMNNGTVVVTGSLLVSGDITDNYTTQNETMAGQRTIYNEHTHLVPNVQTGTSSPQTSTPTPQEV